MNQSYLAKTLKNKELKITKKQAERFIPLFFQEIVLAAAQGRPTKLFGFGIFFPQRRQALMTMNPYKNVPLFIPERSVLRFKTSPSLKKMINSPPSTPDRKMTNKKLAILLSKKSGISFRRSRWLMNRIIDHMTKILCREGRLEISKLGVLLVHERGEHFGIHLITGESLTVGRCKTLTFRQFYHVKLSLSLLTSSA